MPEAGIASKGGKRRRRQTPSPPAPVDAWPPAWRELATRWLRREAARAKWDTLLATAGNTDFEAAHDLLDALLEGGWIAVEETWRAGRWQAVWIEFLDLPALRAALGLPEPGARQAAIETARADLLDALQRWADWPQRPESATRRDFAQFARGDTKGITNAEWDWLSARADLAAGGIGDHTPLLCLAAPLLLHLPRGSLDCNATPDFLALPPATLDATARAEYRLGHWTLVENRTSFERVARNRADDEGVLWLPGFPPGWWQRAVARLLILAPAPARIACDPDPAGIEIALAAGRHWQAAGLDWQPWRMHPADLLALPRRKPLGEHDRERLAALAATAMPASLRALANVLAATGEKGEQEGYL